MCIKGSPSICVLHGRPARGPPTCPRPKQARRRVCGECSAVMLAGSDCRRPNDVLGFTELFHVDVVARMQHVMLDFLFLGPFSFRFKAAARWRGFLADVVCGDSHVDLTVAELTDI